MSTEEPQPSNISPSMQLMKVLWPGALAIQAIHVAAKLNVADLVADGPKTIAELAKATNTDSPSLGRLLRALRSVGLFEQDAAGRYRQTDLSDALRAGHPESIRHWAMMLGARFIWEPCGRLEETIRTGEPAFERVHHARFFKYLVEHPDDASIFNSAMSSLPAYIDALVDAYDFSKFERVVDVGGGQGALLLRILSANPQVRGVLYDLLDVVAGASGLRSESLRDRCEIVGGDFFQAVPAGADAYLLSGILHDWNDAAALRILKNCRLAIRPNGTLLLLETVLTPSSDPARALMDLLMMVLTGGRERTESELASLLREAGFSMTRVISTAGASVIESRPV